MKDLERICRAVITDIFDGVDWRYANTYERKIVRAAVRGVLKAIREPSEAAVGVLARAAWTIETDPVQTMSQRLATAVWTASIDHLLED